jgi:hypothetical protein
MCIHLKYSHFTNFLFRDNNFSADFLEVSKETNILNLVGIILLPPFQPPTLMFLLIASAFSQTLLYCLKIPSDTLKQLRPIGKGEQVLEKRLDQKELT